MSHPLTLSLAGQHVVIVGGSSGMGKATAQFAAHLGAKVTIASRSADKLERAAEQMTGEVTTRVVDTTDEPAVKAWAATLGSVDHLIISASSAAHGSYTELTTDSVRQMFEAKFTGPYVTAREVLPYLNKNGSITFFSGVLSRRPSANAAGLAAVNSAVEGLTRALALELSGKARVNCISPGMVATDAYSGMPAQAREAMYQQVGESLPVGKVGDAADIAKATLAVATNPFITGVVLDIDGGHLVRA